MPALLIRSRTVSLLLLVLVPLSVFLLSTHYARTHFWRDPTSAFFDDSRAYERRYTIRRTQEAREFVEQYNISTPAAPEEDEGRTPPPPPPPPPPPTFQRHTPSKTPGHGVAAGGGVGGGKEEEEEKESPPYMCIGMNTITRPSGTVYARDALGSVLAGLSQRERDQIYLVPMIGHVNASVHPIYGEPWLAAVADRVLTYRDSETLPKDKFDRIEFLETERQRTGVPDREKHLTDYTHLLRVCAATGAPYVAMLEDDVLMVDGWFHRTKQALRALEEREGSNGWFYLRLFYTEANFGWQNEELGWYITYIFLSAVIVYSLYRIGLNKLQQQQQSTIAGTMSFLFQQTKGFFSPVLVLGCLVSTSFVLSIVYVFTSGRLSVFGQPEGLVYMPMYGCCAQGIVYPRNKVEPLTRWYEKNRIGFVDTLAERLADEKPEGFADNVGWTRWGVNPVLLQHVGGKSSKGDGWEADRLWNFGFEDYDPEALRMEHEKAIKALEKQG